jgi:hypothetical protein
MPAQPQAKKDLARPSHRDVLMEAPTAEGAMKVILIALALAGCADQWAKIGVTDQQADVDFYLCKRENAHFSDGSIVGPTGDFAQEEMVRQCMRARGYQAK